jgi:AraC-like DNA-binding protein
MAAELNRRGVPIAQISAKLDFSEPAAFTRAFHRWSGDTPSDYRAEHNPTQVCENPSAVAQLGGKLHQGCKLLRSGGPIGTNGLPFTRDPKR